LLHPKATLAFAPAIIETQSSKARRAILEIIAIFAKKDTKPLDTILKSAEKKLILMLIDLLSRLNGDEFQQMLLDLMDNPSEAVRSKVLKVLLEKDPYMLWRLFNHIEDDSRVVAGVIHGYMGRSRDKMSESLMLDYLEEGQYKKNGRDHVMQCYKTLGRCGSDHSVEFLSDVLLGNAYKERYGGQLALHREGAAIALGRIGTTQAWKILKKASRSLSSKIRQAAKKAMEDAK
jgi:HEAT repeat protein